MTTTSTIQSELRAQIVPSKAEYLPRFFKTMPGGYAEGDKFLGVVVPAQRKIARAHYQKISLETLEELLASGWHEERLTALLILGYKFAKAKDEAERKELCDFYLAHLEAVNNWDLVDSSARELLGNYLLDKPDAEISRQLQQLATSGDLWQERVAIIATFSFIKADRFQYTLQLAEQYLGHKHNLIHKASGWMLREMGQRDVAPLRAFLDKFATRMPRTMLRYAIEKFSVVERKHYLAQKA